jgi:hypothetical protein
LDDSTLLQYESLRSQVLNRQGDFSERGLGLTLFIRRGMLAWMEVCHRCTAGRFQSARADGNTSLFVWFNIGNDKGHGEHYPIQPGGGTVMNMPQQVNQKVTASHLKRQAYCYVRQSTLKQVFQNTESTKRQYALRERAVALGWPVVQIVTIDSDLGETAASVV